MITLFHGVNFDGVGYWIGVVVAVAGDVRSRIVTVREKHQDRSFQLQATVLAALASCGLGVEEISKEEDRVERLLEDVRSSHPEIFGRFG